MNERAAFAGRPFHVHARAALNLGNEAIRFGTEPAPLALPTQRGDTAFSESGPMTMIKKGLLTAGILLGATGIAAAAPAMVAADLNLRAGPGTGYGVVAVMPAGASVNTIGCTGNWCRVNYRGIDGYASASYLQGGAYGSYATAPRPSPAAPFIAGAAVGALAGAAIAGPRYYGPRYHGRYHRGYTRGPGFNRGPGFSRSPGFARGPAGGGRNLRW